MYLFISQCFFLAIVRIKFGNSSAIKAQLNIRATRGSRDAGN